MQKRTKIALLALAGVIAIGGAAAANKVWRHGFHGPGHMMFSEMAERYDANADGKISQAEIDTNRASWLAEFDADKSGTLTLQEFQNLWLKTQNQKMIRDFQRLDRDANGQITLDEYKRPVASLVADLDRNKDSAISQDDLPPGRFGHGHGPLDHGPDDMPQDAL